MKDAPLTSEERAPRSHREWKKWYAALRNVNSEAYFAAIKCSEAVQINHDLSNDVAAAIEVSHVMLACQILDIHV